MKSVLIIGATSDVAKAVAAKYAKEGYDLVLTGRNASVLEALANDYKIRFEVQVEIVLLDLVQFDTHAQVIKNLKHLPSTSLVFAGYLGDQKLAQSDWSESKNILDSNFTGVVSICNEIANVYEVNQNGTLVVLSSVAGERGRQSNYMYGSAKAGLTAYLSGLRNRMVKSGVHVMTVLPGFMATKMTEELNLPALLTAQPDEVADKIYRAIQKKKNIIYVKWIWRYIMLIIRNIPEGIFKKLSL